MLKHSIVPSRNVHNHTHRVSVDMSDGRVEGGAHSTVHPVDTVQGMTTAPHACRVPLVPHPP